MGIFDNFVNKTLTVISDVSEKINNSASSKLKKNVEDSYTDVTVMYYRTYNFYKPYRVIFHNSKTGLSSKVKVDLEFDTVEDMKLHFSNYNLNVTLVSVLSKDYIYITNSGVNHFGSDFRLNKEVVSDLVFYCLYINNALDDVDMITDVLPLDLYKSVSTNKSRLNKHRWSYNIIEDHVNSGRIVVFLMSKDKIDYDENLDKIITNPKELLFDLVALGKSNQLYVTHCGNLGIQINFK